MATKTALTTSELLDDLRDAICDANDCPTCPLRMYAACADHERRDAELDWIGRPLAAEKAPGGEPGEHEQNTAIIAKSEVV